MRKILLAAVVVVACVVLWLGFADHSGELPTDLIGTSNVSEADRYGSADQAALRSYLSNYIVDKNHQIALKDTGLNEQREELPAQPKNDGSEKLVNRETADYFRYLQTHFNVGATLQANTESIHQHLLSTLSKEDAEKLFDLYQKFVDFEFSLGTKTKDWKMPENPSEALALIKKMQQLQQQNFGEENADLLFGGELKTMEYTARRSGILNDKVASGVEKEASLDRLAKDMFGISGNKLDETKNPYNLFEEKLLVYKNDLDKLDPTEAEKLITVFRQKYLPAIANSP